jgi:hypothetical protein
MILRPFFLGGLACASAAAFVAPLRATTATGLSSFEAIEEPLVKYYPLVGKFEADPLANITDVGGGAFRMFARYNAKGWDGDRDTLNHDRQRVEVKGLGPHQRNGDTFEYTTTWRSNPGFRGSHGFCHLFQLKATNGDSGAPLLTLSVHGSSGEATVDANTAQGKITARTFSWRADTWQTVRIRVKTSPQRDGEVMVSIDGDEFRGVRGVEVSRPGANEYRPKWGLYRRAGTESDMGDDYVEHKNVSAQQIAPDAAAIDNAALEIAARELARKSSPQEALAWLQSRPASAGRDFALGSIAALWAERQPSHAMAWTVKLPAGPLRADVIERVFSRWADRDVKAASGWVKENAPRPELDPLLWLFTTDTTYRYVNRTVALDAAPLITDPELRAQAFDHVVLIWARQHPDEARTFLKQTPALTAVQKKTITDKIRGGRRATED